MLVGSSRRRLQTRPFWPSAQPSTPPTAWSTHAPPHTKALKISTWLWGNYWPMLSRPSRTGTKAYQIRSSFSRIRALVTRFAFTTNTSSKRPRRISAKFIQAPTWPSPWLWSTSKPTKDSSSTTTAKQWMSLLEPWSARAWSHTTTISTSWVSSQTGGPLCRIITKSFTRTPRSNRAYFRKLHSASASTMLIGLAASKCLPFCSMRRRLPNLRLRSLLRRKRRLRCTPSFISFEWLND